MPIYEFRCRSCGYEFERLQKISEPDPECCPECGAKAVSRLISPVGFRLKGGGWYETDFKRSNRRNVAEGDAGGKDAKKQSDKPATEAKADKPAAASEKKDGGPAKPGGEAAA